MQESQPRFSEDLAHGLDADEEDAGSFRNFDAIVQGFQSRSKLLKPLLE